MSIRLPLRRWKSSAALCRISCSLTVSGSPARRSASFEPAMERRRVHRPRRVGARVDEKLVRVASCAHDVEVCVFTQVGELERQHSGLPALCVQDADEVSGQVDVPNAHQPKLVLTKSETAEQAERDLIAQRSGLRSHEPVEHIARVRVASSATP